MTAMNPVMIALVLVARTAAGNTGVSQQVAVLSSPRDSHSWADSNEQVVERNKGIDNKTIDATSVSEGRRRVASVVRACAVATGVECEEPKHKDEVASLTDHDCCSACGNTSWCKFWSFKPSDVAKGIACRRFDSRPLRNRSSADFVSGAAPPAAVPSPSTVRLTINGTQLIQPDGIPVRLVGFNWPLEHVHPGDGSLMRSKLPHSSVARIVGK